jgi:16S rRNA (guanine966-N2)-methyltransferase
MRVIAGTAKGRRLGPVPPGTRPVSDMAREGVFASLGTAVPGAACLDLYAGTGAMGIEALSRGAARCRFVERSRPAAAAIRDNLRRTDLEDRGTVVAAAVEGVVRRRPPTDAPYRLVVVDPPYELGTADLGSVLASLDRGWLDPAAWTVVVTRGQKSPLPAVPVHWAARRHLRYGDSLAILYTEVGWA